MNHNNTRFFKEFKNSGTTDSIPQPDCKHHEMTCACLDSCNRKCYCEITGSRNIVKSLLIKQDFFKTIINDLINQKVSQKSKEIILNKLWLRRNSF